MRRWSFFNPRKHRPAKGSQPVTQLPLAADINPTWRRLNRLALWCRSGRAADAELDMHQWQRHDDCPAVASVLLAAMLAKRGELDAALSVLHQALKRERSDDPAAAQLLVTVLIQLDLTDAARRAAGKLYELYGDDPKLRQWLKLMQVPGGRELCEGVPRAQIEHLAAQLILKPNVIATLVHAAKLGPIDEHVYLLRAGVELAGRDLAGATYRLMVCAALTDLALLTEDYDEARRWAHRGLKIDPYCAQLALALAAMADDVTLGPAASTVLKRAVSQHPDYPDLQAALIRRESAQGFAAEAQLHLERWRNRQPRHRLVEQVARELAA